MGGIIGGLFGGGPSKSALKAQQAQIAEQERKQKQQEEATQRARRSKQARVSLLGGAETGVEEQKRGSLG